MLKTTLYRAFDNSDEVTMSFPDSGAYTVENWGCNDSGDGREFTTNGGDDRIDALDQEIEVDESGRATFTDIEGAECEVWFEVIQRRAISADDIWS